MTVQRITAGISVIVHATEDPSKILDAFENTLNLDRNGFESNETTGHFTNPITILSVRMSGRPARRFVKRLRELLSEGQISEILGSIEERTADSKLHLRLGKQELVRGDVVFRDEDPVKITIHTPVYAKRDTLDRFAGIFQGPSG